MIRLLIAFVAMTGTLVVGLATGPRAVWIVPEDGRVVLTGAALISAVLVVAAWVAVWIVRRTGPVARSGRRAGPRGGAVAVTCCVGWLIGVPLAAEAWSAPPAWWFVWVGPLGAAVVGVALGSRMLAPGIGCRGTADSPRLPAARSGGGLVPAGVVTAFLACAGGWLLSVGPDRSDPPVAASGQVSRHDGPGVASSPAPDASAQRPGRYLCVLVDGISSGELDELARTFGPGTRYELVAEPSAFSPTFWRTVVTGHEIVEHGLTRQAARRLLLTRGAHPSNPRIRLRVQDILQTALGWISGPLARRAPDPAEPGLKAVWRVASESGRTVGVVNAWDTWPVPRVRRFAVADAIQRPLAVSGKTGRPARVGNDLVWPDNREWHQEIRAAVEAARGTDQAMNRAAVAALRAGLARFTPQPDLLVIQLAGPGGAADRPVSEEQRRDHCRVLNELLGELAGTLDRKDCTVLFLGWARKTTRATLWIGHSIPTGPGSPEPVQALDVAPSILHGLGLPVSRELQGRVIADLVPAWARDRAPIRIESYGRVPRPSLRAGGSTGVNRPVPDLPYLHPRR